MLNRAEVIGHVGRDPEVSLLNDGRKLARFSVATTEKWTNKTTGCKEERTEWHHINVISDHLSKVVQQYVRKGSRIYVAGKLRTRTWTDDDNIKRYMTDIVVDPFTGFIELLDAPRQAPGNGALDASAPAETGTWGANQPAAAQPLPDDEVPF